MNNDVAVGPEAAAGSGAGITQCELLCFIQRKTSVMAFDDLLEVCSSFYTLKEVEKARSLVCGFVPDRQLTKHKGSDKEKVQKTMMDLTKLCLDPSVKLPAFCVLDISRLPPVGVKHVDVSLMLQELLERQLCCSLNKPCPFPTLLANEETDDVTTAALSFGR